MTNFCKFFFPLSVHTEKNCELNFDKKNIFMEMSGGAKKFVCYEKGKVSHFVVM